MSKGMAQAGSCAMQLWELNSLWGVAHETISFWSQKLNGTKEWWCIIHMSCFSIELPPKSYGSIYRVCVMLYDIFIVR